MTRIKIGFYISCKLFPERQTTCMKCQTLCLVDDSHEMSRLIFYEKKIKVLSVGKDSFCIGNGSFDLGTGKEITLIDFLG